jgi:hypothetical protein
MSMEDGERFELPRKFWRGVIRRERCTRADIEPVVADPDARGMATWRTIDLVVAESGPAAAVSAFAAYSAEDTDFTKHRWGRGSFYESPITDRRWPMLLRLLDLVRSGTDEEYAEAIATAEKMRAAHPAPAARAAMSVLALDRPEWCSQDVEDYSAADDPRNHTARLLMVAATTPEQARELGRRIRDWNWVNDDRRAEGTLLATVAAGADEFLIGCLADSRWHALNLLPKLPSDLAINALIGELATRDAQTATLEAAKRFPRRVLRLLAEAEPETKVDYVLRLHVAANPELARAEVRTLSAAARQRVEALLGADDGGTARVGDGMAGAGAGATIPVAADADLPRALVVPPWEDRELGKPLALKDLPTPAPFFRWPAGVRMNDANTIPEPAPSAAEAGDQDKLVLDMTLRLNSEYEPYAESGELFFRRYPEEAIRQLLPRALGPRGPQRKTAEVAIRFVARHGLADVVAIAAESGPQAAQAAQEVLDRRGLDVFPKSMPAVPLWAEPASLPTILLADRRAVLSADAVRLVVQMLTISTRREAAPYGGIDIVAETCDSTSLAEFAWGLFENWAAAGYPTKKMGWAFDALLWFGDLETARRLGPLVREWPGSGGSARAETGLDVLIALGGDEGVREVYDISQRSKFSAQRDVALRRIAKVAAARGLTADQLEDRLVLDLGAGPDGTLALDYGARRFTVGFDEYLQPFVTDAAGKRRSTPPKPAAADDPALAAAAQQCFAGLKKDAKTVAVRQAERLERAMVTGRDWTEAEFRALFEEHPLMRRLARRLVWGEFDAAGALRTAFRIAEDGTFANVADEAFVVGADDKAATIRVVHPLILGTDLPRWIELCHDYEIIQPFPQVGRPVFALTPAERQAGRLDRFCGARLPTDRFVALARGLGWGHTPLWQAGAHAGTGRRVPGDRMLVVAIAPGYRTGRLADTPEQRITDIWLSPVDRYGHLAERAAALPLGELGPVLASEILADLTAAVAS